MKVGDPQKNRWETLTTHGFPNVYLPVMRVILPQAFAWHAWRLQNPPRNSRRGGFRNRRRLFLLPLTPPGLRGWALCTLRHTCLCTKMESTSAPRDSWIACEASRRRFPVSRWSVALAPLNHCTSRRRTTDSNSSSETLCENSLPRLSLFFTAGLVPQLSNHKCRLDKSRIW